MKILPRSVVLAGAVVVLGGTALAACGSGSKENTPAVSTPGVALEGTTWVLDTTSLDVDGGDAVVSTIRFEDGTASGNDGCNPFTGAYEADGSQLTIGPVIGTQMACEGAAGDVGQAVLGALGKVKSYAISGSTLRLSGADGGALLNYDANAASLEGAWVVTSVLYDDAFRSVIIGTELTADFTSGEVSGSSGCNRFSGGYTAEGDTIKIGPLASTRMACVKPEGVSEQETGYLAALEASTTFEQVGSDLTLMNAQGQRTVTFQKA